MIRNSGAQASDSLRLPPRPPGRHASSRPANGHGRRGQPTTAPPIFSAKRFSTLRASPRHCMHGSVDLQWMFFFWPPRAPSRDPGPAHFTGTPWAIMMALHFTQAWRLAPRATGQGPGSTAHAGRLVPTATRSPLAGTPGPLPAIGP